MTAALCRFYRWAASSKLHAVLSKSCVCTCVSLCCVYVHLCNCLNPWEQAAADWGSLQVSFYLCWEKVLMPYRQRVNRSRTGKRRKTHPEGIIQGHVARQNRGKASLSWLKVLISFEIITRMWCALQHVRSQKMGRNEWRWPKVMERWWWKTRRGGLNEAA